jgi:uncharacterized membrane protein
MAGSISPQTITPQFIPPVSPGVQQEPVKPPRGRIDSIDLLRGIVMVIMMLDHTRDFLHNAVFQFDPLDPSRTNVWLFFTRWITHYCAPVFVFLAGTGAYLQFARGKSKSELSRFLITRGLWLIVLEFTLVRLGAFFSFDLRFLLFMQVIWVIGVSMIVLAALIHLPLSVVTAFGIAMIGLHNLLDSRLHILQWRGPGSPVPGLRDKLLMILHQPGLFPIAGFPSPMVFVLYPLIPWIGVMAAGYAFGSLYQKDADQRRRLLLMIGGTATALFIMIRGINIYGDPARWSHQKSALFTGLSFLNTSKYPPSLLFLLMTLGPAILALALFESTDVSRRTRRSGWLRNAFVTFGRVPLFFYLLQWPTAHLISVLLHLAFHKPVRWLFQTPIEWFSNPPQGNGFNLAVVYAAWISGVLLLYPLCKWFAGVRQRRRDWWLSYL